MGRWHSAVAGTTANWKPGLNFHKDNNPFLLLKQHLAEVITVVQAAIQFKLEVYDTFF